MQSAAHASRFAVPPDKTSRPAPHGVAVAITLVSILLGGVAGVLAARIPFSLALLAGLVLLAVTVFVVRRAAKTAGPHLALALVSLVISCLFYLLVLSPMVGMGVVATGFGFLVWRRRAMTTPAFDLKPPVIGVALGAMFYLLATVLLIAVILLSRGRWWQVVDAALLTLALPALFRPLWILSYRSILSRWQIGDPPALHERLEDVRLLTGFQFDRVMCLRASFGDGRPCFVLLGSSHATLVASAQIVERLTREQLLAILLHEAAHAVMDHGNRMVIWGAVGSAAFVAANMLAQPVIARLLPPWLDGAGFGSIYVRSLFVLLPLMVLQRLYHAFVTRRHEAEADEFATRLVGAPAMLGALEALRGPNAIDMNMHNRWTTHGTWARRSARIRQYGARAADGH